MPDKSRPLVVYCSAGARSAFAAKALEELGYENVVNLAGGFSDWKRNGFEVTIPRVSLARAALPLQPPPSHSRGRRRGAAATARRARPSRRRRRARVARLALPRRRRGRHARDRRRRRRRRVEPPAPDRPLDRQARRAEGELREADARGAEPGRPCRAVPGAADVGERRPDPRGRLGRDRRRRRQLPDAVPRERRVGVERDPRRARLDLPLRRAGHRLLAGPRALLPLPLPAAAASRARSELRRGRRSGRPARDHRLDPGQRSAQVHPRPRRLARRPAPPLRRARHDARRGHGSPEPRLPGLRRQPVDHRVHRLRRVLQRPVHI